nr:hypothetical protein [uncultured Brevundimonas sp.]
MSRQVATSSTVKAGCFVCNGLTAMWTASNAMAVAARHHDATGHSTWADQTLTVRYGAEGPSHPDLFEEATTCG